MWHRTTQNTTTESFETISRICDLAITSDDTLEIRLLGPTLALEDLQFVLSRLASLDPTSAPGRVVIDFEAVKEIRTPWTAVLAVIIQLMRRATSVCSVRGLTGQPAAIFSLYRRSLEVGRLLNGEGRAQSLRRAG